MNNPFQKVGGFIKRHEMLDGATGVLIAVSGGPDSVVLLDMLSQSLTPAPRLHVAHLDHMLRGRESAEDANFVRALAENLGLEITICEVDVRAEASRTGRGIEETAREIRYNFLLATANDAGCNRIAVGHTMTDQAETLLMRLIRGAGTRGLAAMRPIVPAHTFLNERARGQRSGGAEEKLNEPAPLPLFSSAPRRDCLLPSVSIIRPLLCITRDEVESYCRRRGLRFRTDTTNLSVNYTRNRIRTDLLPALAQINPSIVESISRAAENIAADQDVLDELALSLLHTATLASDSWRDIDGGTIAAYSVPSLMAHRVGTRRRMIIEAIRLARAAAGGEDSVAACEVTSVHIAAVEAILCERASGKHISLPGSLEVWREYDALVLRCAGMTEAPYLAAISSEGRSVEAGGFAFTLQRCLPAEMLESVIEGVRHERETTGRDWMAVALDDRVLPGDLLIRPRLRGERAHVIGRRRTIKLKNLMIDHRIPSSRRAIWPLVTTPDGAYIWSPGLPPAVEFAAHEKTIALATLRALPI